MQRMLGRTCGIGWLEIGKLNGHFGTWSCYLQTGSNFSRSAAAKSRFPGTVVVLNEDAEPLKRCWCLFELFETARQQERHDEASQGLVLCTPQGGDRF